MPRTIRTWFLGAVAAVVCLMALGFFGWRSRSGSPVVRLVVPDGYRGVIRFFVDPTAQAPEREGDAWVYRIPDVGEMPVRSRAPLNEWHQLTGVWRSGGPIAVAQTAPIAPFGDAIRLHGAGSDSKGYLYFLIGTDAEMDRFSREMEHQLGGIRK